MIRFATPLAALIALTGGIALAQSESEGTGDAMGHMDHGDMMVMPDDSMSGLMGPMNRMMSSMPMESTGDMDADFLLMMIPHHQSAIDMARMELEQGDDEETRAMAQKVIDAQEAEIAQMQEMLERMGHGAPAQ
ncbi:DUF305 domain-containing protein [Rubellimicrobium arenae]|uniref:DUF305 domain-containing protein n=1 Tax=Rubellimicrobium arenae TaxID=2817372 RepID=UPI001FEE74A8|nr:DUF305 domain-containing protein [Rubellimicrobium arenae]